MNLNSGATKPKINTKLQAYVLVERASVRQNSPNVFPRNCPGTDCGFPKYNRMLKIRMSIQGDLTIFLLSGRIEGECISQLEKLISAEKGRVALDLGEVTIAGLAGVRFLARGEQNGIKIQNCPAFI